MNEPHFYAVQPALKRVPWRGMVGLVLLALALGAGTYYAVNEWGGEMSGVNPFHSQFRRDFDQQVGDFQLYLETGNAEGAVGLLLGIFKLLADEIEKKQAIPGDE